jgi:hypothetical protein
MENLIELEECPCCRGNGVLTHEGGWNVQVECSECGAHTVYLEYETEEQKALAEQGVARLWNLGKVIKINPGE